MCNRVNHYKGVEVGVEPIKPKNHIANQEMNFILYEINDYLYFFRNLYLNWDVRKMIQDKLTISADKLKQISFPLAKAKELNARRDEILDKMRVIYQNLKKVSVANDANWDNIVESMGKFRLSMFLKQKKESINGLTPETKHKWLEDNLLFTKAYGYNESVESIQNEIIKSYKIKKDG